MKQFTITKKSAIISFGLFLLNAVALEIGGKGLSKFSNSPKLDFRLGGYNAENVLLYFNQLGDAGREYYFWINVLDTPFPFLLALFGCCYFSITWKKWGVKPIFYLLIIASFLFMIFDTVENILVFQLLDSFPELHNSVISIASLVTKIKLLSLFVVYGALPITLIVSVLRYLKTSKARKPIHHQ